MHAGDAVTSLRANDVLQRAAAGRGPVHHRQHWNHALLKTVAAVHEGLRSLPRVEDGGRLGEHQIPIHAVVTEVGKRDPDLADVVGCDG